MYLESEGGTGYIMTRHLQFSAPDLRLNVRAPYGTVRVQISGVDGSPVSGLTFAESTPFRGDELFFEPRWTGHTDLSSVVGRRVHVEVQITHGDLYAVRGEFQL